MKMKTCAVFLGSAKPANQQHQYAIQQLAKLLAEQKNCLLYGGSSNGAMGLLADCALQEKVPVTGIMSKDLLHIEKVHPDIDKIIYTDTISQRKDLMIQKSDICITMPGGIGTIEELFSAWCAIKIQGLKKRLIIANIDGYYNDLLKMINAMRTSQYVSEHYGRIVEVVSTIDDILLASLALEV